MRVTIWDDGVQIADLESVGGPIDIIQCHEAFYRRVTRYVRVGIDTHPSRTTLANFATLADEPIKTMLNTANLLQHHYGLTFDIVCRGARS